VSNSRFQQLLKKLGKTLDGLGHSDDFGSEAILPVPQKDFWDQVIEGFSRRQSMLYPSATRPQPGERFWSISAPAPACRYWMILATPEARVELSIEAQSKAKSKQLFDYLHERSGAIESRFGDSLIWDRMDNHNASRIRSSHTFGNLQDTRLWPDLIDWLVSAAMQLDYAFSDSLITFAGSSSAEELKPAWNNLPSPATQEDGSPPEEPEEQKSLPELRFDFWQQVLLGLQERGITLYQQARASRSQFLSTRTGLAGCRYWMTFSNSEIRVELHIDREDRKQNKLVFDYLLKNKARVEQGFGVGLIWDRLDDRQASKVRYCRALHNGYSRRNWPDMIDWLAEHIVRLERGLSEVLLDYRLLERSSRLDAQATTSGDAEAVSNEEFSSQSLPTLRLAFWTQVLDSLRAGNSMLYRNTRPARAYFFSTRSTLSGCRYWMTFGQTEIRIELNIDRQGRLENKQIFDYLYSRRKEIEDAFGKPLEWDRLTNKKVSKVRLSHAITDGFEQAHWPVMVGWLTEHITRLAEAFDPVLLEFAALEAADQEQQDNDSA